MLESNILAHEQECREFQCLSSAPKADILEAVGRKIAALEDRIAAKSGAMGGEMVDGLKSSSGSIVRHSR